MSTIIYKLCKSVASILLNQVKNYIKRELISHAYPIMAKPILLLLKMIKIYYKV